VHLGFGVTLAHDTFGARNAGKILLGIEHVRQYMATSATICTAFASG